MNQSGAGAKAPASGFFLDNQTFSFFVAVRGTTFRGKRGIGILYFWEASMEKRVSFIFYRSFYEAITLLEPEERLKAMMAVCEYGLDGTEPALSGGAAAVFAIARANLDANQRRYENGKKGGRPKKAEVLPKETSDYFDMARRYGL